MNWLFGKKGPKTNQQGGVPDELRGKGNPINDPNSALTHQKRGSKQSEGKVYGSQHVIPMEAFQENPTASSSSNNHHSSSSSSSQPAPSMSNGGGGMFGGMSLYQQQQQQQHPQPSSASSSSSTSMFGGMEPPKTTTRPSPQGPWGPSFSSPTPVAATAPQLEPEAAEEDENETSAFGFLMGDDDAGADAEEHTEEAADTSGFAFMQEEEPQQQGLQPQASASPRVSSSSAMIDFGAAAEVPSSVEVARQRSGTVARDEALAQARAKSMHTHSIFFSTFTNFSNEMYQCRAQLMACEDEEKSIQSALVDLQEKQGDAEQHENFELAEQLQHELEQATAKVTGLKNNMSALREREGKMVEQVARLCEAYLRNSATFAESLQQQLAEAKTTQATVNNAVQESIDGDKAECDAESAKVAAMDAEVAAELSEITASMEAVNDEISAATHECHEQVDSLEMREQSLKLTIEDLRAQLAAKEAELAQCRVDREAVTAEIASISEQFQGPLQAAAAKKAEVSKRQAALQQQQLILQQKQQRVATREEEHLQQRAMKDGLHADIERELADAVDLKRRVDADSEQRLRAWTETQELFASEASMQQQLSGLLSRLEEKRLAVSELSIQRRLHLDTMTAVDTKIPQLEAEKKRCVAKRQYKDAGRISSEIKELETSKVAAAEQEVALAQQVEEGETAVELLVVEKRNLRESIAASQLKSAAAVYRFLLRRRVTLRLRSEQLAGSEDTKSALLQEEFAALARENATLDGLLERVRERHGWDADYLVAEVTGEVEEWIKERLAPSPAFAEEEESKEPQNGDLELPAPSPLADAVGEDQGFGALLADDDGGDDEEGVEQKGDAPAPGEKEEEEEDGPSLLDMLNASDGEDNGEDDPSVQENDDADALAALQARVGELEALINEAVEAEDYEKADALQQELESVQAQLQ